MFNPAEHLMDLKGKQYLQVMWRLVWFREEHPLWNIDTKLEQLTDTHAVFSAKISDETGAQKASGYGSECDKDFRDYIEKAETKAIGRALAMLGYGTQFAPELDEGDRIVDSPVQGGKRAAPPANAKAPTKQTQAKAPSPAAGKAIRCEDCGKLIQPVTLRDGTIWTAENIAGYSAKRFGHTLCADCQKRVADAENRLAEQEKQENAG